MPKQRIPLPRDRVWCEERSTPATCIAIVKISCSKEDKKHFFWPAYVTTMTMLCYPQFLPLGKFSESCTLNTVDKILMSAPECIATFRTDSLNHYIESLRTIAGYCNNCICYMKSKWQENQQWHVSLVCPFPMEMDEGWQQRVLPKSEDLAT